MKRDRLLWLAVILILGLFMYFGLERYTSILKKEDLKEAQRIEKNKKIKIKRKAYMDKIKTISLFGIHFQDDVRYFVEDKYEFDENGIYIGKKFGKQFVGYFFDLDYFNIEIVPPNKNANFIEYYAYYDPRSYAVFKIVGVLPKKFSDFLDEEDKNLDPNSLTNLDYGKQNKAFNKCKEYVEPFISIIDEGIKSKTNLVADDESFNRIHKRERGFTMLYRMNSGLNDEWNFDGFPEAYFNIQSKYPKYITNKDHREPIIRLKASCQNFYDDPNIYVSLSQDIFEGYMISDLMDQFNKRVYEKKLKEEKELLELNKKNTNKSGLQ